MKKNSGKAYQNQQSLNQNKNNHESKNNSQKIKSKSVEIDDISQEDYQDYPPIESDIKNVQISQTQQNFSQIQNQASEDLKKKIHIVDLQNESIKTQMKEEETGQKINKNIHSVYPVNIQKKRKKIRGWKGTQSKKFSSSIANSQDQSEDNVEDGSHVNIVMPKTGMISYAQENKNEQARVKKFTSQSLAFYVHRNQNWESLHKIRPLFRLEYIRTSQIILYAQVTGSNKQTTTIISKSHIDFRENESNYVGKIKTNFLGDEVNVFGSGYNPKDAKQKNQTLREILATIVFENNFFNSKPRSFKVYTLKKGVSYYSLEGIQRYSDQKPLNQLYKIPQNQDKIRVLSKKNLYYDSQQEALKLYFADRVKFPSTKNFILQETDQESEKIRLLFGKVEKDVFIMDTNEPLNQYVAFGIALSQLIRK